VSNIRATVARVIIVLDKQSNGGTALMYAAQGAVYLGTAPSMTVLDYRDLSNVDRYKVLKEWDITLIPFKAGTLSYAQQMLTWNTSVDIPMFYDDLLLSTRSDELFVMFVCFEYPVLGLSGNIRLRYMDD